MIDPREKTIKILKALEDPVYFCEDEYFLGAKLYPKQAEVLRKFYNGGYNELVLIAGMRCLSPETIIYTNPYPKPLKELNEDDLVLTFRNGKFEWCRCQLIRQRARMVYRLVTYSGREIYATENHPILTSRGWMTVSSMLESTSLPYVAMCHKVPPPLHPIHDPDYATAVALFLSEGCWITSTPLFSNRDPELIDTLRTVLKRRFNGELRGGPKDFRIISKQFREELHELKGKKSAEKFIPKRVFELDDESLKKFIYYFWRGDGGIEGGKVHFYSTSKRLLQQLQFLLLRFGIRSYLRRRPQYKYYKRAHPEMKSTNESYDLVVHDDISTIIPEAPRCQHNGTSPMDKIGLKLRDLREICETSLWKLRQLMCTNTKNTISLKNARKIAHLIPMFGWEDVYFEPIVRIEPIGVRETYDLSVPHEGHAFVANGIIVHNSGKTFLASCFAAYEAFKLLIKPDPAAYYNLAPGSPIFIVVVATSEKQAYDTIFNEIKQKLMRSPFFREYHPRFLMNEIIFQSKNVRILCGTSSSASLVGRNVKLAIFDELARFEESTSKRGAWEVYTSLKRSTATFGKEGYCISISSIRHPNDIMMTLYRQAQTNPRMFALKFATWEFNPNFKLEDFKFELQRDPLAFWRDFGSKPFAGQAPFFANIDVVPFDSSIPNNLELLARGEKTYFNEEATYVLAGDPAIRHDAFGLAIVHEVEPGQYVCDGLYRFKPMGTDLSPVEIKNFILRVLDHCNVITAVFDTWNFPELQEEIRSHGVEVLNHIVRKEDYDRFKEFCFKRCIRICDYPILRQELEQLQIVNVKRVDHPPGGSKDVADALVNALWAISEFQPELPLNVAVIV